MRLLYSELKIKTLFKSSKSQPSGYSINTNARTIKQMSKQS